MKIEKIIIENFKSIKNKLELNIDQNYQILIGKNGSGKSTILEAIHLMLTKDNLIYNDISHKENIVNNNSSDVSFQIFFTDLEINDNLIDSLKESLKDKLLKNNIDINHIIKINELLDNLTKYIKLYEIKRTISKNNKNDFIFKINFDNEKISKVLNLNEKNINLNFYYNVNPKYISDNLLKVTFLKEFTNKEYLSDISFSNINNYLNIYPIWKMIFEKCEIDISQFKNGGRWIRHLKIDKKINCKINELLEEKFPRLFKTKKINFEITDNQIEVSIDSQNINDKNHDIRLYLNECSDGYKKALSIVFLLIFNERNDIVLIDEPEMNLHPECIIEMSNLFREIISENSFVACTTHSPFMLDKNYIEEIKQIENDGIETYINNNLDDYTIYDYLQNSFGIELLTNNIFTEYTILVEGKNDYNIFKKIFDTLCPDLDISIRIGYGGNFINIAKVIKNHFSKKYWNNNFFAIVDYDKAGISYKNGLINELNLPKENVMTINDFIKGPNEKYEIEDLLGNNENIKKLGKTEKCEYFVNNFDEFRKVKNINNVSKLISQKLKKYKQQN